MVSILEKNRERNINVIIGIVLALLYLSMALLTLPSTGIVVDENRYIAQAKAKAYSIYATATGKQGLFFCQLNETFFGTDWTERCWEGRARSPSMFSGVTWATAWYLSGQNLDVMQSVAAHRAAIILMTAIGIFVLFVFVSRAFSREAALFSSLALIFMPRFFAQSKYMLFDLPSAIMWLITVWLFWKGLRDWRYGLLTGVAFGIALTTKEMVLFLPVVLLAWLLISYRDRLAEMIRGFRRDMHLRVPRIPLVYLSFIFLSPLVMFLLYPWIWYNTLERLMWLPAYYGSMMEGVATFYMGQIHAHLPWHYTFMLALAATPLVIVAFSLLGVFKSVKDTITLENRVSFLILLSALSPMVVLSIIGVVYNGVQEFLPAFPFIAILSGMGASCFLAGLRKRVSGRAVKAVMVVMVFLFVFPGLLAVAKGHADSYYNGLFGGAGGVYRNGYFEAADTGEPYLEAAGWLNNNIERNATIYVPMFSNIFNTYKYGDVGQIADRFGGWQELDSISFSQKAMLREDIKIVGFYDYANDTGIMGGVDYIVLLTRQGLYGSESYVNNVTRACMESCEPIHSVVLDGAPLVRIYRTKCA